MGEVDAVGGAVGSMSAYWKTWDGSHDGWEARRSPARRWGNSETGLVRLLREEEQSKRRAMTTSAVVIVRRFGPA
ncbi:hypothetical protein [Acidovorax delafieldii]|uniref:hypothetical protein n=1 Tax=Acidovorax delafieldii TaxID=47920 RepID=UPI000AEAF0ED|nr:hypothetical protein [Acidovorax delafieldii]